MFQQDKTNNMNKQKGLSNLLVMILAIFFLSIGIIIFLNLKQKKGENFPLNNKQGLPNQKRNLVALGASYSKANNISSQLVGDNQEYSFVTGTKIESFYLYLKKKKENVEPINLAESGADSQKVLSQQVPNTISYQPKYVIIDIMADIFEEETPKKFKQNLIEIVKQIKNQDNIVFITTYPNLILMRKASYSSCVEDKLHLGITKVNEEILKLFNQAISDVASEFNLILVDNFSVLDSSEVSNYDCLHPNIEGQKKLAQALITAFERRR